MTLAHVLFHISALPPKEKPLVEGDPKPESKCGAGGMKAFGRIVIPEGTELYWDDENHKVSVRLGEKFISVVDILNSGKTLDEVMQGEWLAGRISAETFSLFASNQSAQVMSLTVRRQRTDANRATWRE